MLTEILKIKGDWEEVVNDCRSTVGKAEPGKEPSTAFKRGILIAEHSPIRDIIVKWRWKNIKYWITGHWARHKWEKFIRSQRTDRTGVPRDDLPQSSPVEFTGEANAQHLIDTMRRRLYALTKEQRIENLVKNGITPKDLEKAYEDGLRQGLMESGLPLIRSFYAALCLSLQELHGFGPKRCYDVLTRTDHHITDSICSADLVDEVLDKLGLEIDISDVEGHVSRKAGKSA